VEGVDVAEGGVVRRKRQDPLRRFLSYLVEIEHALMRRDALGVTALLRKRTATHLPREVREELLAVSRASRDSLRAPIKFLRFQHRMTQLAEGGEKLPTAQTELRLRPLADAGAIRREDRIAAARTLRVDPGSDRLDDAPGRDASES
jgi:hypothetical protein